MTGNRIISYDTNAIRQKKFSAQNINLLNTSEALNINDFLMMHGKMNKVNTFRGGG